MPFSFLLSSCEILGLPLPHLKVNSRVVIHSTCFSLHSISLCTRSFPSLVPLTYFKPSLPFSSSITMTTWRHSLASFSYLDLFSLALKWAVVFSGHTLLRHIHILSHTHTYMFTHALTHVHTHSHICPQTLTLCSLGLGFTMCETGSVITMSLGYSAV